MPTTSTSPFLKLPKDDGREPDDVEMTQVQVGAEPGPLLAGQARIAVMYEPGLDQVVAKGMEVVPGFSERYGPYAFSMVSARRDVDPAVTRKAVTGLQTAIRFMQAEPDKTVAIAKKQFPDLAPAVVEAAVERMMREIVYPDSVDITAEAPKTGMETQVTSGQPLGAARSRGLRAQRPHRDKPRGQRKALCRGRAVPGAAVSRGSRRISRGRSVETAVGVQ